MPLSETISTNVARMLKEKKITRTELAERTGVTKSNISRYLNGAADVGLRVTQEWAEVIGVDPVSLMIDRTPKRVTTAELKQMKASLRTAHTQLARAIDTVIYDAEQKKRKALQVEAFFLIQQSVKNLTEAKLLIEG